MSTDDVPLARLIERSTSKNENEEDIENKNSHPKYMECKDAHQKVFLSAKHVI